MMKRVPGIVISTISLFIMIFLLSGLIDNNIFSKILSDNTGEVPKRDTVLYKRDGNFIITKNGSLNFYEPGILACATFSKTPFSIGNFVSDANGVLNQVEASGYMKLNGRMVACRFSSITDRPLPYSIFFCDILSRFIRVGIVSSCLLSLIVIYFGFFLHVFMDKIKCD